ncbi:sensor domain-containing diguanylate cyclase [Desulfothermus sp.]
MEKKINLLQKIDKISRNKNCCCKDWDRRELLELVIDSFSEGIVVLNSEGKVCFCNRVAEDILGYRLEDLICEELHPLFIKDNKVLSEVKEEFKLFASTGTTSKFHKLLELNIKACGREKKIQLVLKPLKFQGEWLALGILSYVPKKRELNQEIFILERNFQLIFDAAADAILLLDKDGTIIDTNFRTVEFFGGNRKNELIGKTPYDVSPEFQPNGRPSKEMALEKISSAFSGRPQRFEWMHKRLYDETILFCDIALSRVDLPQGPYVLAILRDISQRKILEEELKKKNRLIFELSETAPVGIIRFSAKGEIEYMNQKAKEIFSYMGGRSFERDCVKSILKKYDLLTLIEESSKYSKANLKEFLINIENGKKWLQVMVDPIEPRKNSPVRMILRDITSEKMVELAKEAEQRKSKILLESLPHPAWLVTKERKIIAQNKAAEMMGSRVGDYCWRSILDSKYISHEARKTMERTGIIFPGIKCVFCMADEALISQQPKEMELDIEGKTYDVFWIPVDKNLYLHYLIDVTKYKQLQDKLIELSMKDPLTGLYNRRFFEKKFEEERERCKRFSNTFSIIMLDIDDFKKINDTYGHNVGDEVLINIANTIMKRIRKIDIAARWGGEEFVILLPETNLKDAVLVAENIRISIAKIKTPKVKKITASFGVAEYRDGDNLYKLINRADEQLYKAKRDGKNLVCYKKQRK